MTMLSSRGLERGVDFSAGELRCDQGAEEALAAPDGSLAVRVYFETEVAAKAFATTLPGPVGVARVTVHCAD